MTVTYEDIYNIISNADSCDFVFIERSCIVSKDDILFSIRRLNEDEKPLKEIDGLLDMNFPIAIKEHVTYDLYYNNNIVSRLRFARVDDGDAYVPYPFNYCIQNDGTIISSEMNMEVGRILSTHTNRHEYGSILRRLHIRADDSIYDENMLKHWI